MKYKTIKFCKNVVCAFQTTYMYKLLYFFYLERFPKKLADDQFSSIAKGNIYHINNALTTFLTWK